MEDVPARDNDLFSSHTAKKPTGYKLIYVYRLLQSPVFGDQRLLINVHAQTKLDFQFVMCTKVRFLLFVQVVLRFRVFDHCGLR